MLFYKCLKCGNFVTFLSEKSGCTPTCCGETMTEIVANTTDAAQEKHVPVVVAKENKVRVSVGSVEHPMTDEHFIEWVILETSHGYQKKDLKPGDKPEVTFVVGPDDHVRNIYAYCNLHGLWKTEVHGLRASHEGMFSVDSAWGAIS